MDKLVRLICHRPTRPTRVGAVRFATLKVGADTMHISSRILPDEARQFLRVSGYAVWEGDEATYGPAIDAAIEQQHPAQVGAPKEVDGIAQAEMEALRAQYRQLEDAHRHLQTKYQELNQRANTLQDELENARKELAEAKAKGFATGEKRRRKLPDIPTGEIHA